MKFYAWMSRLPLPRLYVFKILIISFVGVHIPMIGAVTYILLSADISLTDTLDVLAALLLATLAGTGVTMTMLYFLLAPVRRVAAALRDYLQSGRVPSLPTRYDDEVGVLLANVQETVTRLDMALDTARTQRAEAVLDHRRKFEVLAGMSHDLRTPLNHMIGFAEVMSTEALGPLGSRRYRDYASNIRSSGGDLLETLQTILDLSAEEAEIGAANGIEDAAAAPADLGAAIAQAVRLTHFHTDRFGTVVNLAGLSDDGPVVTVPDRVLKQIILHTLQAAIGTPVTASRLEVSIGETAGHAILTVISDLPWAVDDVPAELSGPEIGGRRTGTPETMRSTTQQALRLSLISSLARGVGATVSVSTAAAGARALTLTFRKTSRPTLDTSQAA
ncbi:MAG: histidine kinase dimerization/phospho-acceptor domain-containing protein [Thalassobaculaceae bacterium]|nr:histidine kinase dimerization/phospho-acceptor domain-containing protein [Thalassobaculaceae bacterium]